MRSTLSRQVVAFTLLAIPAAAQTLKLNGPLARGVAGEISFPPQASPDGKFQVYTADRDGDDIFEFYSVLAAGTRAPVLLFSPVPEYVNALISTDGSSVFLVVDLDGNASYELASVPIDGSAPPTVLSDPLAGSVAELVQSQGGARLLYLSNPPSSTDVDLFSVPSGGGTPVKLNGSLVPGGRVWYVELSNDGSLALYSADQDTDERVELFVAPVDGSSPARKLPIPLVPGGSVALFQLAPDGSRVFYSADQEEDERYELFSIAIDGSQPPRKLNGPLAPGGDVGVLYPPTYPCWPYCASSFYPYFNLSLDGQWIVYTANQDRLERFELYSVPADGSRAPVKLSAEPDRDVFVSTLTYDSAWVIYQTEARYPGELLSVPIDGSAPARRISGPTPRPIYYFPQVSFDSRFVVYQAQEVVGVDELYSAPVDGSTLPVKLNAPFPPGGELGGNAYGYPGFWVMESGVVYQAEQEHAGLEELYFVPVPGGVAPRKLASGPIEGFIYPSYSYALSSIFDEILFMRPGELFSVGTDVLDRPALLDELPAAGAVVGDVEDFELALSGDRVLYHAREDGDELTLLHSVRPSKPSERGQFHAELFITSQHLVPDGSRVIFLATVGGSSSLELYSAPADGGGAPANLSETLGSEDVVSPFLLAPDGRIVVFRARVAGRVGIFSTHVDGGSSPVSLSAAVPSANIQGQIQISADGSRVAFLTGDDQLYVVPIDGHAPALPVSAGMRVASSFQLTRDGSRVVFQRKSYASGELFVASSDASAAPLKLTEALHNRGSITRFALAPDSTRAVYLGDQAVNETYELHSVPIDGSAPAVRLHATLGAGRDVEDFQVSGDSRRVVYRADALVDEQLELFSVPIDASRSPVRLNGNFVPGGDVLEYRISPDGTRVVYLADQQSDNAVELFSTHIQGSRRPAKLSRPLVPGGDVRSFQISADSRTVVFDTRRSFAYAFALLAAPIGGQAKAAELSGPFQDSGTVLDYRLGADGSIVYRADQDTPGVIELYAAQRAPAASVPAITKR